MAKKFYGDFVDGICKTSKIVFLLFIFVMSELPIASSSESGVEIHKLLSNLENVDPHVDFDTAIKRTTAKDEITLIELLRDTVWCFILEQGQHKCNFREPAFYAPFSESVTYILRYGDADSGILGQAMKCNYDHLKSPDPAIYRKCLNSVSKKGEKLKKNLNRLSPGKRLRL